MLGCTYAVHETLGTPISESERQEYSNHLTIIRRKIGAEAFEAAFAAGQSLSWDTALAQLIEGIEAGTVHHVP